MQRAVAEKLQQIATHITQVLQEIILPPLQKEIKEVIDIPVTEWEIFVPPNAIEIVKKKKLKTALWVPYPTIYLYEISATVRITFRLATRGNKQLITLWKIKGEVAMIPSPKGTYSTQKVDDEDEEGVMQSGCVLSLSAEKVWVEGSLLTTTSTTLLIERVMTNRKLQDYGLPSATQISEKVNLRDVKNIAQYLAIHFLPIRYWTESCGHLLTRFLLDALQTLPSLTLTDDLPFYELPDFTPFFISYTVELNCVRIEPRPSFVIKPLALETKEEVSFTLDVKLNSLWEAKVTPDKRVPPFTIKIAAEIGITLRIDENLPSQKRTVWAILTLHPKDTSPKSQYRLTKWAQTTLVKETIVEGVSEVERVVQSIGSRLDKEAFERLVRDLAPNLLIVTRELLSEMVEGTRRVGGEE